MGRRVPSCFETPRSAAKRVEAHVTFCCAAPQHEGTERLCRSPVFLLFRPVIDGKAGRPARRRTRSFPVFILELTGRHRRRVVRGLLLFSCSLHETARRGAARVRRASKAVGLIDPAVLEKDLSKLDSKAIFSCNGNNWSKTKYGDIIAAQYEAEHHINGGVYEKDTGVSHEAYPKYFLSKFESSLI